jgi:xanthine dehydrogenase FAD-binding subunit
MAGGTDLLVAAGRHGPCDVALLEGIPGLDGVDLRDGHVRLGAMATHADLARHPLVRRHLPVLAQALAVLGSPLVRNMGTLGGNIVTASPAGDTLPPLYVLDAQAEVSSREGVRRAPIGEFILGPGRTALEPGSLITAVHIPLPPQGCLHHFEKVGRRDALAVAVASLAALIVLDGDGRVAQARIAAGSVGLTVVRCHEAQARLLGRRLDREALVEAGEAVRRAVSPLDDIRATADYRRKVAGNLLLRLTGR